MKKYKKPHIKNTEKKMLDSLSNKLAKAEIRSQLKKVRRKKFRKEKDVKDRVQAIEKIGLDGFSEWFCKEWVRIDEGMELMELIREKSRLEKQLNRLKTKQESFTPKEINDEDIEKANSIPLDRIAEDYIELNKVGKNYQALCPFHDDNDPSFTIFSDTNSFYCFGCEESSTPIDFVMQIENKDFKNAVNYILENYS